MYTNDPDASAMPTLGSLACALLAFPLGAAYAPLLIGGLALGLVLAPVWVGVPILVAVLDLARNMAASERHLLRTLLGVSIPAAEAQRSPDPRARLRADASAASTWRMLIYLLLKLPLGALSFVLVAGLFALALRLLLAPLTYTYAPLDLGFAQVSTGGAAAASALLGALLLPLALAAARLLAQMWAALGRLLLSVEKPKRVPGRTVVIVAGE
jgi:hypothetical protein